jgi:outer membrane protein
MIHSGLGNNCALDFSNSNPSVLEVYKPHDGEIMMKTGAIKGLVTAAVSGVLLLGATAASAYQAGDMVLRAGLAGVLPTGDGTHPAGLKTEADDGYSLGITFTWMATDNLGLGVLGAWPFKHDVEVATLGDVAEVEHLPPTVTLQYHFDTASNLHPYVGAGVNYTTFLDEDTEGALAGAKLDLDDSWGLALEAGIDMELQNNWTLNASAWWIDIDTDATVSGAGAPFDAAYEVEIDPWVFMVGIGKKF